MPVLFKALHPDSPIEMLKYLKDHCRQSSEKDEVNNK